MPELSRAQIFVYAALAVCALIVGSRWIRSEQGGAGSVAYGSQAGSAPTSEVEVEPGGAELVVHVAGEVQRPGVYELPFGSRVGDAIKRAGGPTAAASPDQINLAAPLADGQQVQVPSRSAARTSTTGSDPTAPISLGTATAADLETIEGIGPVTAAAILAYRDEHGGLASIDELDQVSGIGPATIAALSARLQP